MCVCMCYSADGREQFSMLVPPKPHKMAELDNGTVGRLFCFSFLSSFNIEIQNKQWDFLLVF
jgi:hypothetical protein